MAAAKAAATTNHWNEIGDVERWQGHSKEMWQRSSGAAAGAQQERCEGMMVAAAQRRE